MEITENDLRITICTKCRGSGQGTHTERIPGGTTTQEIPCPACGGRTVLLTPVGAMLFDFVHEAKRFSPRHF
jgi:Tryptophan RNA-binding attenuator protein inhibitory protein